MPRTRNRHPRLPPALERCLYAVKGGNLMCYEVAQVIRAEKSFRAFKQPVVVLIPPETLAGLEQLFDLGIS